MVVVADDEQIEVARGARDGGDLLLVGVEDGLAGDRGPVRAPAPLVVPVGRPDVAVVADDEQVEVARGAGDRATCYWSWSKRPGRGPGTSPSPQPPWSFQ